VYDKDTGSGSYLKQLMMNLDENPFGIITKKSFLHGEASGSGLVLEPIQGGNGMMHQSISTVKTKKLNSPYVLQRATFVEEN